MIENKQILKDKNEEPRFGNYNTWYRFYQNLDEEINYEDLAAEFENRGGEACFGALFYLYRSGIRRSGSSGYINVDKLDTDSNQTILIVIRTNKFKHGQNNYCLLNPELIEEWCNDFNDVLDYKTTVRHFTNCSIVRVDLPKVSRFGNAEKVLLTWIRYLYEHPYNYLVVDTMRLKKTPGFENYSLIDLYNITAHCINTDFGTGHSISKGGGIYPREKIKEHFESSLDLNVNDLCRNYRYPGRAYRDCIGFQHKMSVAINEEEFNKRLETYKQVLELFINWKNEKTS